MKLDFAQVIPSMPFLLGGIIVTLKYTLLSVTLGFFLGIFLALMRLSNIKALDCFSAAYTSIFRGTPLLVQLMLIYFGAPRAIGYTVTPFEAGVVTFSLNSGAYVSEIIRAGIQAVDRGQFEAAKALGIPYTIAMKDLILPQAIKNILPALVNEMVNLLKESSLISVIGEMDLLRRARIISAEKFIYFEPLIIVAALYYIMVVCLASFAGVLERKLQRSDRN